MKREVTEYLGKKTEFLEFCRGHIIEISRSCPYCLMHENNIECGNYTPECLVFEYYEQEKKGKN